MDECKVCANADNEYCFACDNGNQFKPMINADRIRSMTDEELAQWLAVFCNGQTPQKVGKPCVSGFGTCEECWLEWLREEANDGKSE